MDFVEGSQSLLQNMDPSLYDRNNNHNNNNNPHDLYNSGSFDMGQFFLPGDFPMPWLNPPPQSGMTEQQTPIA